MAPSARPSETDGAIGTLLTPRGADDLVVIAAGRVVASGPLESVVGSHAGLEEAFLELTTGTDPFHASWLLSLAVLAPAQASSVMVTAGAAVPGRAARGGRRAGGGGGRRGARRPLYGVG